MAEQRSPLKEFRHLDEKLRTVGLSRQEQSRWEELRDLVSSAAPLKPGFDVKAAAAELKASLEPAGLGRPAASPPPAPLAAPEPEQVGVEDLELEPMERPAEWPPPEQGQDAAVAGDPAAWDAGAADPGAQPYDPNAQIWDASAQPADAAPAWDAAAFDPNAPPAEPAAQPYDPNAPPAEPGAQPYDPNAQAWDASAQPSDAAPAWDAAAFDPNALPAEPGAQPYDPNAQIWDASAQPPDEQGLSADLADAAVPAGHDASTFAASALDFSGGDLMPEGSEAPSALPSSPQDAPPADPAWAQAQPEPAAEPGAWEPAEGPEAEALALSPSQDSGEAVPPPTVEDAPPIELSSAADFLDLAAAAQAAPAPPGAGQGAIDLDSIEIEEMPTVEVEEVLEEPPPAKAAEPPPAPPQLDLSAPPGVPGAKEQPLAVDAGASASFVAGEHRVVVHTIEGQVLRGSLVDVDLDSAEVPLGGGGGIQLIPSSRIKAIFFMLLPGGKPPPPEGKKVRVTFRDGRQVAGFSADYDEGHAGFFMVPADSRTNTGRIWVYREATRQVSVT
jgi:hypothetical protein